jgi:3-hydroxy-3-methylglutaryl CoA synthase
MFSYGSGLASTLFSFKVAGPTGHIAQAGWGTAARLAPTRQPHAGGMRGGAAA